MVNNHYWQSRKLHQLKPKLLKIHQKHEVTQKIQTTTLTFSKVEFTTNCIFIQKSIFMRKQNQRH